MKKPKTNTTPARALQGGKGPLKMALRPSGAAAKVAELQRKNKGA